MLYSSQHLTDYENNTSQMYSSQWSVTPEPQTLQCVSNNYQKMPNNSKNVLKYKYSFGKIASLVCSCNVCAAYPQMMLNNVIHIPVY